jgi:hypothetical protein
MEFWEYNYWIHVSYWKNVLIHLIISIIPYRILGSNQEVRELHKAPELVAEMKQD